MFFVDDGILCGPDKADIESITSDFNNKKKEGNSYDSEDCGDITDYLGINFIRLPNSNLKLLQSHLIDQIIRDVGIDNKAKAKRR